MKKVKTNTIHNGARRNKPEVQEVVNTKFAGAISKSRS